MELRLARYLRGPKYEQLQQAIANSEMRTTPGTPNTSHQVGGGDLGCVVGGVGRERGRGAY